MSKLITLMVLLVPLMASAQIVSGTPNMMGGRTWSIDGQPQFYTWRAPGTNVKYAAPWPNSGPKPIPPMPVFGPFPEELRLERALSDHRRSLDMQWQMLDMQMQMLLEE